LINALTRYTDFRYFYRRVDQKDFKEISPLSVKPIPDGSVTALFCVPIDSDATDQKYESFFSYLLDGEIHKTAVQVDFHKQTNEAEQTGAVNPHAFGTFVMPPADSASRAGAMPKASGDT
jgi:hypothetical protein